MEDENKQICLSFQCEQPFASNFDQQANSQALALLKAKLVLDDQYTKADLVFGR